MDQLGTAPAITEETAIEPVRKIRAELNVEKWSIWRPAKSKTPPTPRKFFREDFLPNGDKVTRQVTVSVIDGETLTTEDQKTYYVLVEIWEANGRPNGQVPFSLSGIAKRLDKGWGTNSRDAITQSLKRLRGVLLTWENAYYNAESDETMEMLDTVNTVSELKIFRKKKGEGINDERGYFRFSEHILVNLQERHTKPVLLQVVLSFKSEIAQIIYTQLDRILSRDITTYEKRTKELFEDLGLDGKAYVHVSKRKQVLAPAIAELENAPLSNGATIARVTLEKTVDGKDYKLVVKRGRARAKNATPTPRSSESQENPHSKEERLSESRIEAKNEPTDAERKGNDLVAYFQQIFFGAEKPSIQPTQKHRELAAAIIASHGETVARYIVDFAKAEAEKTNYRIATFGAVANYVDRAVASYTLEQAGKKKREERERAEAKKQDDERAYRDRTALGFKLYNALPDAERIELTNYYQAILATSDDWKDKDFTAPITRKIFESAVKAAICEHLRSKQEAEPLTAPDA
jgi:hypothetical protein